LKPFRERERDHQNTKEKKYELNETEIKKPDP